MSEPIPLEKRVSQAIEALVDCAEENEQLGEDRDYRCALAADLLIALNLGLLDLALVAEIWMIKSDEAPGANTRPKSSEQR